MKFCKVCGNELKEGIKFCKECGASLNEPNHVPQQSPMMQTSTSMSAKSLITKVKDMSKLQKIISSIVVSLLVLFFVGYQIGAAQTSKEKVIDRLQTAIIENDTDTLAKLITSDDTRVEITEKTLESFVAYVNENPRYIDELMNDLEAQSRALDEQENVETASAVANTAYSDQMLTLTNSGKTALIFDKYRFNIQSFYIGVYTNYEGATIYLNGEEIGVADSSDFYKEFGPYVPGNYTVKAEYKGEFATLEEEQELSSFDYNGFKEVNLHLSGIYVDASSNYDDAMIYVNGSNQNITAQEFDDFGPVSVGTNLQAVKSFPWGEVKSEEASVEEGQSYYEFEINPVTAAVKDQLVETAHVFQEGQWNALVGLDSSLLKKVTPAYKEEITETINDYAEDDRKFYTPGGVTLQVDLDYFEVSYSSNNERYEANARYIYEFLGGWGKNDDDEETIENRMDNERTYYIYLDLIYDEATKQWLVDDYSENNWSFTVKNKKEISF